jgi:hypothetical protein
LRDQIKTLTQEEKKQKKVGKDDKQEE